MKSFEVIYRNGQLINAGSKQQIHLVPGKHYFINGDDDAFLEKDFMDYNASALNETDKKNQIFSKYKAFNTEKILPTGRRLYFRVGLSKKTREDDDSEYLFEAKLLEDLYIKSKDDINWSLCECQCESSNLVEGQLPFIHTIKGSSLSNLFANIVTHYFSYKRSTACNAFNSFALTTNQTKPDLNWIKREDTVFLDKLRKEVASKFNQNNEINKSTTPTLWQK